MYRPMIKPEHRPFRYSDHSVRIGGVTSEAGTKIPDPDGWVWALLGLLDGTRTEDGIVTELARRFPHKTSARVRTDFYADLAKLVYAGYIEDAAEPPPLGLSAAERERYSRGRALWRSMDRIPRSSSWDVQMQLRQAKVVVVGVGGIGNMAALTLALSGIGELHLVEPDVVNMSDLNRDVLFTERDVGRPKVNAAVERLRNHNSSIKITGEAFTITGPTALLALAFQFDVVVLAADESQDLRSWTNRACVRSGTPWTHGSYDGPQINVGLYQPGTGPCYDCAYTPDGKRRSHLPHRTSAPGNRVWAPQAANAVSAGIAGQLTAHAAMSLITDVPGLPANREYGIDLMTLETTPALALRTQRPDCPTCGAQASPA